MIFIRAFIISILSISASCICAHAERVRISGIVTDSVSKEFLPGARIEIRELKKGAISKKDGSYEMRDISHGIYTLYCFSPGYKEYTRRIDIHEDLRIDIELSLEHIEGVEVLVTGKSDDKLIDVSHAISTLSPKELDEHRGQTLGETLGNIPGITILQTGASIAKPMIHGLHSERVLVLNSGVLQQGQQWGAEHAPEIDPFAASKIVVIKGASGIEYGAGAIGGIISIEPRELKTTGVLGGEVDVNLFSNNQQASASLLVESPFGSDFGARLQVSGRYAGDTRTPTYVLSNSGFRELNGSFAVGYNTIERGVELDYIRFSTKLGIYKGSHFGNKDDLIRAIENDTPPYSTEFTYHIAPPKQIVSHDIVTLKAYQNVDFGKLLLQYGFQRNNREEYDAHINRFTTPKEGEALTPSTRLLLSTYTLDSKLQHVPIGNLYGTVGLSLGRMNNAIGGKSVIIPEYTQYSSGLYIVEHLLFGPIAVDAGVRYDVYHVRVEPSIKNSSANNMYHGVSGSVGLSWLLSDTWTFASDIAQMWRRPSINELYSYGVHHGTAQFEIGNAYLDKEHNTKFDVTLKHRSSDSRVELSLYYNYLDDYIYLRPDTGVTLTIRGAYPTFYYAQSDAAIFGIDVVAEHQLFEGIKIGGWLSVLKGDDIRNQEPLYQMPPFKGKASLHLDLPLHIDWLKESFIELSGTYVAEQTRVPVFPDYSPAPPAYALCELVASTHILAGDNDVLVSLSIENVLNTTYRDYLSRYRYFADAQGRNIIARVSIPFGDFHIEQ